MIRQFISSEIISDTCEMWSENKYHCYITRWNESAVTVLHSDDGLDSDFVAELKRTICHVYIFKTCSQKTIRDCFRVARSYKGFPPGCPTPGGCKCAKNKLACLPATPMVARETKARTFSIMNNHHRGITAPCFSSWHARDRIHHACRTKVPRKGRRYVAVKKTRVVVRERKKNGMVEETIPDWQGSIGITCWLGRISRSHAITRKAARFIDVVGRSFECGKGENTETQGDE